MNLSIFNENKPAVELVAITRWINSDKALLLSELKGSVVLVDFWTNQCINCIHTLPYVCAWYSKYKDRGFIVIGVHTPEFEFEKTTKSVEEAIEKYKIEYPVAQDNNYATWKAYDNHYWPGFYLIDKNGFIRRTHFGEGEYDKMDAAIEKLLHESK